MHRFRIETAVRLPLATFIAGLVLTVASTPTGASPFKTSEERIPKEVSEITTNQIRSYFTPEQVRQFKGIPLLDPKIEWNDFRNWPDKFTFQGQSYSLELYKRVGDSQAKLNSRAQVKTGMGIVAHYHISGKEGKRGPLSPSGVWDEQGSIEEKVVDFNEKRVFAYTFYPDGALDSFHRVDFRTKHYRIENFTPDGKKVP